MAGDVEPSVQKTDDEVAALQAEGLAALAFLGMSEAADWPAADYPDRENPGTMKTPLGPDGTRALGRDLMFFCGPHVRDRLEYLQEEQGKPPEERDPDFDDDFERTKKRVLASVIPPDGAAQTANATAS